jgi:simple sugar transport system permease protein
VIGTVFGVLINGLIQMLIIFNGELSSWWTRIAIGALTLIFIGVQSAFVSAQKRRGAVKVSRKEKPVEPSAAPLLPGSSKA